MIKEMPTVCRLKTSFERLFCRRTELDSGRRFTQYENRQPCLGCAGRMRAVKRDAVQQIQLRIVLNMLHVPVNDGQPAGEEKLPRLGDGSSALSTGGSKLDRYVGKDHLTLRIGRDIETDRITVRRATAVTAGLLGGGLRGGHQAKDRSCCQQGQTLAEILHVVPNQRS